MAGQGKKSRLLLVLLMDFNCSTPGWSFSRDHHKNEKIKKKGQKLKLLDGWIVDVQDVLTTAEDLFFFWASHGR
jgi:hypothetical protein